MAKSLVVFETVSSYIERATVGVGDTLGDGEDVAAHGRP